MTDGSRLLTYLARAYALTQAIPLDHPLVQDALVRASEALDPAHPIRVALTSDGFIGPEGPVDDPHGEVERLAEALFGAGVRALVLSEELDRDGLEGVLRALRSGTAEDVRQRLRDLSPVTAPQEEEEGIPVEAQGAWEEVEGAPAEDGDEAGWEAVPVEELAPGLPPDSHPPTPTRRFPDPESLTGLARCIADMFEELERGQMEDEPFSPAEHPQDLPPEVPTPQEAFQAAGLEGVVTIVEDRKDDGPLPQDPRLLVRRLLDVHGEGRERVLGAIRDQARENTATAQALADALASALADSTERSARRACIDALVAIGRPGRHMGERMLEDSRWFVVRNGVSIVAETGGPGDVPLLMAALSHSDPRVRREVALALARLGGPRAGELVTGLLQDPAALVRVAAARAIGALRLPDALEPLLARLDAEPESEVEEQIVRSLGALGDDRALQAIARRAEATFFRRPGPSLRLAAYRALAAIGTPDALEVLKGGDEDRDPDVRSEVRGLLQDLGSDSESDEGQDRA